MSDAPNTRKLSYLEALTIVHNNLLVDLAANRLNVRVLGEQSVANPIPNTQVENNLVQFKNIVSRLVQSIQILTRMIEEEKNIETTYEAKDDGSVALEDKIKN